MSALSGALRGLADEITASGRPATRIGYAPGEVASVTGGVVTVAVLGDETQAAHLGPLPAVGDTVAVLFIESSPLILGVLNGIPTF